MAIQAVFCFFTNNTGHIPQTFEELKTLHGNSITIKFAQVSQEVNTGMQPLKVSKNLLGYNSTNSKKFKILTGHLFHAKSIPHTLGLVNHLLSEQEIYF